MNVDVQIGVKVNSRVEGGGVAVAETKVVSVPVT
jgi:hypothetical protein